MKNEKFYKPLIITLGIAVSLIVVFYVNEEKQISTKEGLTGVDGSTIYLETPIEPNGYIDQMVDDSSNIELDAQNLLNTYSGSLSSTDTTNLTNIIQNQQNIQSGLSTVKTDYTTVLSSLENETNALVSLRTDAIEEKQDQYDTLVNERQNKRRLVKNNKYYENRYIALSNVMFRLSLIILVFTGLIWLNNRGYLGEGFAPILFPVLIALSLFYILKLYVDIQSRNSSDFDKYNFEFNAENPNENENFTTINETSGEFNRVKKYNKEFDDEEGKYSKIEPFVRPVSKNK
tara:strand:+ start:639 stop:1505 length:867 start_codon:yes stop_codon:yes gene_type:complete